MGSCQSQAILNETHQEILPRKMEEDLSQPPESQIQYGSIEIYQKEDHMLLKKLGNHFPFQPNIQVRNICYIPEKNLLVAVTKNYLHVENLPDNAFRVEHMINIYNTMRDFNLVAARRIESEIYSMVYSKELGRILAGGDFLQIWNLKTFQIEAESEKLKCYVSDMLYIPSSDVIATMGEGFAGVYDRNLVCQYLVNIVFVAREMTIISPDILLCVCTQNYQLPTVFLWNLKRRTLWKCDKLFIPYTSCVAMTEETPKKIFTCLTGSPQDENRFDSFVKCYNLTQFTINEMTEELVILRMAKGVSFNRLLRSKNGKFFIAGKTEGGVLLLNIKKDKAEVICAISEGFERMIDRFIMFKDDSTIVFHVDMTELRLFQLRVEKPYEKEIKFEGSQEGVPKFLCM